MFVLDASETTFGTRTMQTCGAILVRTTDAFVVFVAFAGWRIIFFAVAIVQAANTLSTTFVRDKATVWALFTTRNRNCNLTAAVHQQHGR